MQLATSLSTSVPRVPRTLAALLFTALGAGAATAQSTLRVPADFSTIQGALDSAADGDTVLVAPGTYLETVDLLGKAVLLRSEAGPERTVIDGGGQPVYTVRVENGEGPSTRIEGFTITGGVGRTFFNQQSVTGPGGGIRVHGASPVLVDLIVTGNAGPSGGGIHLGGGSEARVESCRLIANEATRGGGLFSGSSRATLVDVSLVANRAVDGGGLLAEGQSLTIEGALVEDNTGTSLGGGMYLNAVAASISGVRAERNGEKVPVGLNSFTYTVLGGGGLYATNTSGILRDSFFVDNAASIAGGLYLAGGSTLQVVNNVVRGNDSGTFAGGIYFNGCSAPIVNCTIVGNFPAGIFTTFASFPTVRNSILAANGGGLFTNAEIYGNGVTTVSYSLAGSELLFGVDVGPGVVVASPLLDGDLRPLAGSPVIDAGDNSAVPAGIVLDLAGSPRFRDDLDTPDTGLGSGPIVDLGAYEFQPAGLFAPSRRRR